MVESNSQATQTIVPFKWREEFKSELKAALFVASLISIGSNFFHFLDAVKYDYFELASTDLPGVFSKSEPATDNGKAYSTFHNYGIDNAAFESQFASRTPLDRALLVKQLSTIQIDEAKQVVLFIDLDLSPFQESTAEDSPRAILDAWLTEQAEKANVSLILPVPMPVLTNQAMAEKIRWINTMRNAGVYFVIPSIPSVNGSVLTYFDFPYTLAATVKALNALPASANGRLDDEKILSFTSIMKLLALNSYHQEVAHIAQEPFVSMQERYRKWINFSYFEIQQQLITPRADSASDLATSSNFISLPVKAGESTQYIVFGGQYGLRDIYDTPMGDRYGAELHLAALYTLLQPIKELIIISYLTEVVLGTGVGIVFSCLTYWYRRTGSLTLLIVNFVTQPLMIFWLIWLSAWLMASYGLHINAGVLGVAMSIHTTFVRLEEPQLLQRKRVFSTRWVAMEKVARNSLWYVVVVFGLLVLLPRNMEFLCEYFQ